MPTQLLTLEGLFNPKEHRQQPTLRIHLPLLDFLRQATFRFENWMTHQGQINQLWQMANSLWYGGK